MPNSQQNLPKPLQKLRKTTICESARGAFVGDKFGAKFAAKSAKTIGKTKQNHDFIVSLGISFGYKFGAKFAAKSAKTIAKS